jgi:hypothetical protein
MLSTFRKSQNPNKRASRTEGFIRLLLIILWALVVVVLPRALTAQLGFHF